jgi:hypothetical protein
MRIFGAAAVRGEAASVQWLRRSDPPLLGAVTGTGAVGKVSCRRPHEAEGFVLDPVGDDVDDVALLLDLAVDRDHRGGKDGPAIFLVRRCQMMMLAMPLSSSMGDEGDVAGAGTLADEDDAGKADPAAVLIRLSAAQGAEPRRSSSGRTKLSGWARR